MARAPVLIGSALALLGVACNVLTGAADLTAACGASCESRLPERVSSTSSTEPLEAGAVRDASPSDGGEAHDAGSPEEAEDASTEEASDVRCGAVACGGATPACCVEDRTMTCVAAAAGCRGLRIRCDETADCSAGQVCCLGGALARGEAVCIERVDCWGANATVMCKTSADCAAGQVCLPFAQPEGYRGCVFL